jgi:multiple sugar transport system ATP-binding protein
MLAGLERISSGTIRIGDTVVNELPPRERNVAMVFQSYALYPHLSVFEAMTLADRVAIMRDGLLQQVGAPREIYDRAHVFDARNEQRII